MTPDGCPLSAELSAMLSMDSHDPRWLAFDEHCKRCPACHQRLQEQGMPHPAVAAGPQVAARSTPEPPPHVPGYDVLERIGWGGMGVVWRCRDHVLPRYLAMKVPPERCRDDANFTAF